MKPFVRAYCGNNLEDPEILVTGSLNELAKFGQFLLQLRTSTTVDVSAAPIDDVYPRRLETIQIDYEPSGNDLLKVRADETCLYFGGTATAIAHISHIFAALGDPDVPIGYHIHLDYYEGHDQLEETRCNLVFSRDS